MNGYRDYNGPEVATVATIASSSPDDVALTQKHQDDDDNNDMNPLQAGFWMEGDSMAPPCGTSVSTIHKILEYLQLDADNDILYDLGCGDGRICLEAWHLYKCKAIGIEVEDDLSGRAQCLIRKLLLESDQLSLSSLKTFPDVHCMDLRHLFHLWAKIDYDAVDDDDDDGNTEYKNRFPLPTIIFLYLLPEALLEIKPKLKKLLKKAPKNCRIVCNTWGIPAWKPIQETTISEATAAGVSTTFYIYTAASVRNNKVA
jgi:hypothetical protein